MKKTKKYTSRLQSLSVVIATYNDASSLASLLRKIEKILPHVAKKFEIIIVDDASQDDSSRILSKMQKKYKYLSVFQHKVRRGVAGSLITAFKKTRNDFVFYMDAKEIYDIYELPKLVGQMNDNVDVVSGFATHKRRPLLKKITGTIYNFFVRHLFGLHVKDIDCEFRLFRRTLLDGVNFRMSDTTFGVELIRKFQKKKARFKEVAIENEGENYYQRVYKMSDGLKTVWTMFQMKFSF